MPKEAISNQQAIKGSVRLNFMERRGYWSQEDRPEEVTKGIEDFITEWQGYIWQANLVARLVTCRGNTQSGLSFVMTDTEAKIHRAAHNA